MTSQQEFEMLTSPPLPYYTLEGHGWQYDFTPEGNKVSILRQWAGRFVGVKVVSREEARKEWRVLEAQGLRRF